MKPESSKTGRTKADRNRREEGAAVSNTIGALHHGSAPPEMKGRNAMIHKWSITMDARIRTRRRKNVRVGEYILGAPWTIPREKPYGRSRGDPGG